MIYNRIIGLLLSSLALYPASTLSSQVRFSRPDTTPDYTSYRYFDECSAAADRLKELASFADPVWQDTVSLDTLKRNGALPKQVVKDVQACLAKINIDTIPLKVAHEYATALLVANRDLDVERLYMRLADSIEIDSTRNEFFKMINVYSKAAPVRYEKLRQLYELGLERLPDDSVAAAVIFRGLFAEMIGRVGDYTMSDRIVEEILDITDTLSEKYRDTRFVTTAKGIFNVAVRAMTDEAADSLTVSTDAYKNYIARVWKSLVGYEAGPEITPYGTTAPEPVGHFYYSNTDTDGGIPQEIQPRSVIEKGKVTIIHFLQGGCHSTYQPAGNVGRMNAAGRGGACWEEIHKTKKILKQYPNINLVVVSHTFGTIGDAPPLEPKQEADTLADYFLRFHGLKGTHVVYKSDFIRLAKYDNRKIDTESAIYEAFQLGNTQLAGKNNIVMIDELGKIFHFGFNTEVSEHAADAKLKIVMNRAANRMKD